MASDPGRTVHRQAVVIVHGMGEQRPGDTLQGFIDAALPALADGRPAYYSKPDTVSGSYEARRYLSPAMDGRPQTEFFEYHWAHLMQGNALADLLPTVRRILLRRPPSGLRVVWGLSWLLIAAAAVLSVRFAGGTGGTDADGDEVDVLQAVLGGVLGAGVATTLATFVLTRLPGAWLTTSFVDVARYLDTSPRSYEVRRAIREGMVTLLRGLHESQIRGRPRYGRIIVVAHSLGGYIAYDAVTHLWATMNDHGPVAGQPEVLPGVRDLEAVAARLTPATVRSGADPVGAHADYLAGQRRLWATLRDQGHPWLVTDLVTLGTPMYFADRLANRSPAEFAGRVRRGELSRCPPIDDPAVLHEPHETPQFTWRTRPTVLHEAAPFAVVRWTNAWFPARWSFFGDWFGGPLAGLFGPGVVDTELVGNAPRRLVPGLAHTFYFRFPTDVTPASATSVLRKALDFGLTTWTAAGVPLAGGGAPAEAPGSPAVPPPPPCGTE